MTAILSTQAESLQSLGNNATSYKDTYDPGILETFNNRTEHSVVMMNCPEFTALCPKTGQPDFAHLVIAYEPVALCVESKSLKLYLFSFRSTGAFHEDVVSTIRADLQSLLSPSWIAVRGHFMPRGGISINPLSYAGISLRDAMRATQRGAST